VKLASLLLVAAGCGEITDTTTSTASVADTTAGDHAPPDVAPPLSTAPRATATGSGQSPPKPATPCAPSLAYRGRLDARTSAALDRCESLRTGLGKISKSCGLGERTAKDRARFLAAVPAVDGDTKAHIRELYERGKRLGRKADVFGLVGDSITVSTDFMAPFSSNVKRKVVLDDDSRAALTFAGGESVIDVFRRTTAEPAGTGDRDSFSAFRAAKVGASANWAVEAGAGSPVAELMQRVNPSIVIVTFGANDAAAKNGTPEQLADEFERHVLAIVRFFEERGVVVILSGEMRHGDAPGVKACPSDGKPNDWAIAVATNATVARMAEIACRERLPFIDLRHALDVATNYGLGPDSVHMTTFQEGAGVLDARGLDCGNNIRNFVTLLALKRVREALLE
jgi:hypothetical protein